MLPALWEIIIPLILAVLLGIVIGWLMWRWRRRIVSETQWLILEQKVRTLEAENAELRACDERALDTCRDDLEAARARIAELEGQDDPEVNWQAGETSLGTPGAAHQDDLKVVNGIGPKMEELLNSFGIQSWEQLAWLTDDQVQTVDAALEEFPGRIERDEWVQQGKDLIARFPDRSDRPTRATLLNRSDDSNPQ